MGRVTSRHKVVRIDLSGPSTSAVSAIDTVAGEEPLEIRVDGEPFTVLMRTPGHDIDLAHGLLRSEGLIRAREDIRTARYCADLDTLNVLNVQTVGASTAPALSSTRNLTAFGGCGLCGSTTIDAIEQALPDQPPAQVWPATVVASALESLRTSQAVFAKTGGVHAAGLVPVGHDEPVIVREDIGRHNAVDKVLGSALINDVETRGALVVVSSRASFEIVQKAAMAGVSTLACVSAPSSLAVDAAERLGLCLIAFARGSRMNVYAHADRIGLSEDYVVDALA